MAQHYSFRIPWHDSGWNGNVCENPLTNNACLRLDRIAEAKQPDDEAKVACEFLGKCNAPCIKEGAAFMSDKDIVVSTIHPYASWSPYHDHLLETKQIFPAYSYPATPYKWLMKAESGNLEKDIMQEFSATKGFQYDSSIEPVFEQPKVWVQHGKNQKAIFDSFFGDVVKNESLCVFYAKEIPFTEDPRRVIIGIGHIKNVRASLQYDSNDKKGMPSYLWENIVEHTIRPDMKDGFILPYQELWDYCQKNKNNDFEDAVVFADSAYFNEYSYKSEHLSNDAVIDAINQCIHTISLAKEYGIQGEWDRCLEWLNRELIKVWKDRGAFPGLKSFLVHFKTLNGVVVAREINEIGNKTGEDYWNIVNKAITTPKKILSSNTAKGVVPITQDIWERILKDKSRYKYFKLLCRLDLSVDQVEALFTMEFYEKNHKQILENPYLLFELSSEWPEELSITIDQIDKALFPVQEIAERYPLPKTIKLETAYDKRRLRAVILHILMQESDEGNTILPLGLLCKRICNMKLVPICDVTEDIIMTQHEYLSSMITVKESNSDGECHLYYKMNHYEDIDELIKNQIRARVQSKIELANEPDWETALNTEFGEAEANDEDEQKARQEKIAALKSLSHSRFSVFVGGAGTGKTKVLSILCSEPQIRNGGILLLAPTGKARVRMQIGNNEAFTIAQFLYRNGFYNPQTQTYSLKPDSTGNYILPYQTVIVDEASMITEDMMGALFSAVRSAKRIILVGDSNQLPPIGAGKPFVDIINYLVSTSSLKEFPYVGENYARLTITRRQKAATGELLSDVRLAERFVSDVPVDDEILFELANGSSDGRVVFDRWRDYDDLQSKLYGIIESITAQDGAISDMAFTKSLGGYYKNGDSIDVSKVENWQILTPVRNSLSGVININQQLHEKYRRKIINNSISYKKTHTNYPQPYGAERIVCGDKVINTINQPLYGYDSNSRKSERGYVANGEIGIVTPVGVASHLNVEFSSQKGLHYNFLNSKQDQSLELAYALTVHKAQGSQFGVVILVLSDVSRMMTRELLYTALSRQVDKIYILYDKDPWELNKYSNASYSEIASRLTDLLTVPKIVKVNDRYYEESLIHVTEDGTLVRSKSEAHVYNALLDAKEKYGLIEFEYEHKLTFPDGSTVLPDFYIINGANDKEYYWEHLGLPNNPRYMRKWRYKEELYRRNGISVEEGNLIVTMDGKDGSIDTRKIKEMASRL